jgi:acyl-CoA synthetase (AMP-forming)/AMP-acid ligase II
MHTCEPTTITEFLVRSALDSCGALYFLDDNGDVTSSLTYGELVEAARLVAKALLSSGLASGGKDIVVTNFSDQRTHILMFWGCCFGRSIISSSIR